MQAGDSIGGFNAPKPKTVPHFNRSMGTGHMFGPRSQARGLKYSAESEIEPVTRKPNRLERRGYIAMARRKPEQPHKRLNKAQTKAYIQACKDKRIQRQMIIDNRPAALLRGKPHRNYVLQYFDPEQQIAFKEEWAEHPERRAEVERIIRNRLKAQRKAA